MLEYMIQLKTHDEIMYKWYFEQKLFQNQKKKIRLYFFFFTANSY